MSVNETNAAAAASPRSAAHALSAWRRQPLWHVVEHRQPEAPCSSAVTAVVAPATVMSMPNISGIQRLQPRITRSAATAIVTASALVSPATTPLASSRSCCKNDSRRAPAQQLGCLPDDLRKWQRKQFDGEASCRPPRTSYRTVQRAGPRGRARTPHCPARVRALAAIRATSQTQLEVASDSKGKGNGSLAMQRRLQSTLHASAPTKFVRSRIGITEYVTLDTFVPQDAGGALFR